MRTVMLRMAALLFTSRSQASETSGDLAKAGAGLLHSFRVDAV